MSTMPGTVVSALRYHDYMWILTVGEPAIATVDGAPPGERGRIWGCHEPNRPFKVPYEAGRFLLEHLAYTGVVRVDEKERSDGTGTDLDIAKAKEESELLFEAEDARRWREYVEYCINDKMNNKKAIPATPESIKKIMARRGYKLSTFGIAPIGEGQPEDLVISELRKQNEQLAKQMALLAAKLDEALGEPVTRKGK
jgi:hypothetical protein